MLPIWVKTTVLTRNRPKWFYESEVRDRTFSSKLRRGMFVDAYPRLGRRPAADWFGEHHAAAKGTPRPRWGKETGVHVTAHRLRHTFATQLVNAGCPILTVQALMGHKRLQTTLTYAKIHNHTVERDYLTAMQVVEERFRLGEKSEKPKLNASTAPHQLIHLLAQLPSDGLTDKQMALLQQVHQGLQGLAG